MKKKTLTFLVFCICCFVLSGHEFWLQPQRFHFNPGQTVLVKFQVGENFEGENWNGNRNTVQDIKVYLSGLHDDVGNLLSDSTTGDSLTMQFFDAGTVMVTCRTNNRFIHLSADTFNTYLEEDGLDDAIAWRKEYNETDSAGREFYQRSVKTLIQIGTLFDSTYKRKTNLPLDIIPLKHPYLLKKDHDFGVRVLFNGEPLSNTLVKVWHRTSSGTEKTEMTTDKEGRIYFPVSLHGMWMVSTVKIVRTEDQAEADWQSYWGSLTWGY